MNSSLPELSNQNTNKRDEAVWGVLTPPSFSLGLGVTPRILPLFAMGLPSTS